VQRALSTGCLNESAAGKSNKNISQSQKVLIGCISFGGGSIFLFGREPPHQAHAWLRPGGGMPGYVPGGGYYLDEMDKV